MTGQTTSRDDRIERVCLANRRLADWIATNGSAGYDPYDLLGHPLFVQLAGVPRKGLRPTPLLARALSSAANRWPVPTRRLLGVSPTINAKGVGLLIAAWHRVGDLGDARGPEMSSELAAWLVNNPSRGYPGTSWGYPFDWQSRVFIPRGTPSAVVTSTCAQSLLDHALRTGDRHSLRAAREAAIFLSEGLNRYEAPDGSVCLSYTPVDDFRVHNASLMAGEYLLRAGREFEREDWSDLAVRVLRYTLADQGEDGSFEYWGPGQRHGSHIDNYHTGFVLRSLHAYAKGGVEGASEALERGWRYYRDHFFGENSRPLDLAGRAYPLNVHSCAESVLCPALLSDTFPEAVESAIDAAYWTAEHMSNSDGSFAYILRADSIDRTAYLRWGQAWMFRAFTELMSHL